MRYALFAVACLLAACNNSSDKEAAADAASTPAENITYAYTIDHPVDYWRPGDVKNIAIAMNALKAWEEGKVEESMQYFADSVHFSTDDFDATVSKDSLLSMMKSYREGNIASISIKMNDCESVKSIDGKEEYVSLWYEEHGTYKDGKAYAHSEMDDIKMSGGKIIGLDTKMRHLPKQNP